MTLDELKRLIAEASKGPWRIEEARDSDGQLYFFDILAGGKYRGNVATVRAAEHIGGITWPEAAANARLIAAAPDLAAQVVRLTEDNEKLRADLAEAQREREITDKLRQEEAKAHLITISRADTAEARAYELAVAIMGGEDAPGYADSIPTDQLVELQRKNRLIDQETAEAALRSQRAEVVKGLGEFIDAGQQCGCGPGYCNHAERNAMLDDLRDFTDRLALIDAPKETLSFQDRVKPWMLACFGEAISADRIERNHRFLEEALELVQANGCTQDEAHQLVDYVYGRDVGEINQEVGGVMVTLAALCLASGLDMHSGGETELARIWTKVEQIRAKQAAKPKHSPLPGPAPKEQQP